MLVGPENLTKFIKKVFSDLKLTHWVIWWEEGSGGVLHPNSEAISLGINASKTMFLHEVAHIGYLNHDTHWASRFTDLVECFLEETYNIKEIQDQEKS